MILISIDVMDDRKKLVGVDIAIPEHEFADMMKDGAQDRFLDRYMRSAWQSIANVWNRDHP